MGQTPLAASASIEQSQLLYRRLLTLIKNPLPEERVLCFVVDAIFEQFPSFRCTFSRIEADGLVTVKYSRQPPHMASITGKSIDLKSVPRLLAQLLRPEKRVITDVRESPTYDSDEVPVYEFTGSVARIDVPVLEEDGSGAFMLSLASSEPQVWHPSLVELLEELGELVTLLLRDVRTRSELENSELLFRQFAENVEVVVWMSDIQKNDIVYVNPAYERIWGRSVKSLYERAQSFLDAVVPEDRARVVNAVMKQAEGNYEQIYRIRTPKGELRWIKDRGFLVRNQEGVVYRIVGIAEDITALKQAQENLEASRAKVISNTKFAALGEMASGIAHEINNPLAVIHGLTVQLQEMFRGSSDGSSVVMESLASIEKMANRIAGIVKGLRTFSRRTDGDPLLSADLSVIMQETVAMCEAKLRGNQVALRVFIPPHKVAVRCRSSEISQVMLNLINNAYDAVSNQGEKRISIGTELREGRAIFFVEDNGPGVAESLREKIFQPFFTTKEVGKGTGLGLSISKGIVEAHGGSLHLESGAKGARFVVELAAEKL